MTEPPSRLIGKRKRYAVNVVDHRQREEHQRDPKAPFLHCGLLGQSVSPDLVLEGDAPPGSCSSIHGLGLETGEPADDGLEAVGDLIQMIG
jgi:hypothetical protein